jgi:hypothetical protein
MSTRRKMAPHYEVATARSTALRSIGDPIDLGNGINLEYYIKRLQVYRDALNDYNTILSAMDEKRLIAKALEKEMKDLSTRMLAYVAARYGKDSIEYAKAGGTKTSERKKPKRSSGSTD